MDLSFVIINPQDLSCPLGLYMSLQLIYSYGFTSLPADIFLGFLFSEMHYLSFN